jgi:hypothetical protein
MRKVLALGLATAGVAAAIGALTPGAAQAAEGECVDVNIANAVGKFDGWQCQDSSGTAVGGQLRDTKLDGLCVVVEVEFTDGVRQTQEACDGQRWPRWVGTSSSYQGVLSIDVVTI